MLPPFLAWRSLSAQPAWLFLGVSAVIRALISRTSCQQLPEVGAGRGGKQGQSKVKFAVWDQGRLRQGDGLADSPSLASLQPSVLQVRTPGSAKEGTRPESRHGERALLSPTALGHWDPRAETLPYTSLEALCLPSIPTPAPSPVLSPQSAPLKGWSETSCLLSRSRVKGEPLL